MCIVCSSPVLDDIFCYTFQLSLSRQRVSIVVPVAKRTQPRVLSDFRPSVLKKELLQKTESLLEPLQFAHRAKWGRGVEDGTLLNLIFKHFEGSKTHAKILFVDFSSALNTIQAHV